MRKRSHRGLSGAGWIGVVLFALGQMWTVEASAIPSPPQESQPPAPAMPSAKPCVSAEYRQFDFWLGEWDVFEPGGEKAGSNRIESILGGCALAEHWTGAKASRGTSLNFYDHLRKRWHQTWIDNQGAPLELDGGFAEGKMTLAGDAPSRREPGKTIRHRITWSELAGGRVRQLWEASDNGGKTWNVVFDGTYVRRE